MLQADYDIWIKNTSVTQLDIFCGNDFLSTTEQYFIRKFSSAIILDIGCGTGHRIFPFYLDNQIDFLGIEKYQFIINQSKFKPFILEGDITSRDFLKSLTNKRFGLVAFFCGVINSVIDAHLRNVAWENIYLLAEKYDFVLLDTLSHFSWFYSRPVGKIGRLSEILPPQYYYSDSEIKRNISNLNLEILEEKEEQLSNIKVKYYLITIKNKPIQIVQI